MPKTSNTGHHHRPRPSIHDQNDYGYEETGDWATGTRVGPWPYVENRAPGWRTIGDGIPDDRETRGRVYRRRGRVRRWWRTATRNRNVGITALGAVLLFLSVCVATVIQPGPVSADALVPLFILGSILIALVTAVTWLSRR